MFATLIKYWFLFACLLFFTPSAKADVVKKYIQQYSTLVESLSAEFGIPRSIITAISIVESGAGRSRTAKLLNNHFGVVGKNNLLKTKGIKTKYKRFSSAEESFREFCKMITRKKYYASLKNNMQYNLWINAMAKAGYSTTAASWKKQITHAIKKYKLYELDNIELITTQ